MLVVFNIHMTHIILIFLEKYMPSSETCHSAQYSPLTKVKLINELNEREAELGVKDGVSWHSVYKDSAWIFIGKWLDCIHQLKHCGCVSIQYIAHLDHRIIHIHSALFRLHKGIVWKLEIQ